MLRFLTRLFDSRANTNQRARRTTKTRPQLAIELLEDRLVPSTLQIANGLLTYTASTGVANNVSVSLSGTTYTIQDTAEKINVLGIAGATGSGTNAVTLPAAGVQPAGMLFNLGDLNDVLSIQSTANAISVKGGDGNDTIDVGKFGGSTLGAVQAPVTVDGELGTDTLRVNNPAAFAPGTYTITATGVTAAGGPAVSYAGTENLAVNAGLFPNTFNVLATAAGTRTTLNGGQNGDTFNVGSTANTLDGIQGALTLNAGAQGAFDHDTVNLFDQGSIVGHSYTLRDNSVARSGAAVIAFSNVEQLTLNAGSAADSATVLATAAGTQVTLNMGGGNDVVNLATRTGSSLDTFLTPVTVNGEAGTDTVILNDQVDGNGNFYAVTSTNVTRNFTTVLNYANAESLILNAGNFNDTVTVQSTLAATPVTLKLGDGDDTVNIQNTVQSLDDILGTVTVDGQLGSDQLNINDQGEAENHDYTITATAVSRSGAATVNYANLENLVVNAGSAPIIFIVQADTELPPGNHFFVKGTSATTTLNAQLFDTIIVGSDTNSLDGIKGALNVVGGGTLTLNDQGDNNGNSYTITNNSVARSGAALISYTGLGFNSGLTVNAGAFNDTVDLQSAFTEVILNLGAGNDTVTLNASPATGLAGIGFVTVHGQAGADAIVLNDNGANIFLGGDYRISSTSVLEFSSQGVFQLTYDTAESLALNAGSADDSFTLLSTSAATPVVIRGGAGNDTFKFGDANSGVRDASGLLGALTLDGQDGTDTLNYSAYVVGVRVNLTLGTATGAAGGVSNIDNIVGGQGNDILVGNDLSNFIFGGDGRDILIGGAGGDVLFGEAGDDILVGDSTVYDSNQAALEDIMREWGRTDLTGTAQDQYNTRVFHLLLPSFGGGLNGSTSFDSSHVISDGVADSVDGGADLNWIL